MNKTYKQIEQELEAFLETHVPLARAAQVRIVNYSGDSLKAAAPLDANINDKGTAFGGSLYNLCVITGWGLTSIKCKELGLQGDIVVAKGEIDYLSPLREDLVAEVSSPSSEEMAHFEANYRRKGRAALTLEVLVNGSGGQPCVRFKGKYAIVNN